MPADLISAMRDECPLEAGLHIIGGRWKGAILYCLTGGSRRYNELRRLMPQVTQRMMTLQLRELEASGVVHREVFPSVPPCVEYSLTELGRSLEPALMSLRDWGERYQQMTSDRRQP
ncbi:hypothetical protein CCAX7_002540 [Capsulimonas corticalis]|uniref:Uncharacterized protein n=1 Tax=Capsulimonas corticalis TaxID=2219043 RepID=A0A402CRX4_9BACT|nr:helix-turn-helix domain-containing protein [Capsulimonas corticalis]BDI28203.1 hypothetical protein CCAX7_002540 [Capsulimonas corticalis]